MRHRQNKRKQEKNNEERMHTAVRAVTKNKNSMNCIDEKGGLFDVKIMEKEALRAKKRKVDYTFFSFLFLWICLSGERGKEKRKNAVCKTLWHSAINVDDVFYDDIFLFLYINLRPCICV